MSSSIIELEGENLNEFQTLFMSLPKSTQQQLLGPVVKGIPILHKEPGSPIQNRQQSLEVKIEPICDHNRNEKAQKVFSNLKTFE